MRIIRFFKGASGTSNVFLFKDGRVADKGLGWSGLLGPYSIIALVPTTPQIIDFAIEAKTSDKQKISVTGNVTVNLVPGTAVSKFDFTVDDQGNYQEAWDEALNALVVKRVLRSILKKALTFPVESVVTAHAAFDATVLADLKGSENGEESLASKGIVIDSCSVATIVATDRDVDNSLGAKEKQTMLTTADSALHDRRAKALENDRKLKKYEVQTLQKVEEARESLIQKQNANKELEASGDAIATETRLGAFEKAPAGKVLSIAMLDFAKAGKVEKLVISPDLVDALNHQS